MKKGLFTVNADGFKFMVIASNVKEVKEHCFRCFDYEYIIVKYMRDIYSTSEFPQFVGVEL